eukprot:2594718-Prymnesium_polylepis.1
MMTREHISRCICATFISSPAEALLGGLDVAIAAERAAGRLRTTDPEIAQNCAELADGAQQAVAGLLQ